MPIYEYECKKCGKIYEEIVRLSDATCPPCPKCKNTDTQRLMSASQSRTGALSSGASCGPSSGGFS